MINCLMGQLLRGIEPGFEPPPLLTIIFPTPISKLMYYLHCVGMILDLSSIPSIEEYM